MRRFSKWKARWASIFYTLFLLLSLLLSCATAPSNRKYVGQFLDSQDPSRTEKSFPELWERWTVYFGATVRGGKPWLLGNPLTMLGGGGGPGGEFPLQIAAILMDTTLIEAGLQQYAALIAMTPEEEAAFRSAYSQRYDTEDHLLIWCKLQTNWSELYLDPDRWIIFIEDDAINQYEPIQILEESQPTDPKVEDWLPEFSPKMRHTSWQIHQRSWMLCFPQRDLLENPVLTPEVKFLKLVFQQSDDEKTKAEGIWVFKK